MVAAGTVGAFFWRGEFANPSFAAKFIQHGLQSIDVGMKVQTEVGHRNDVVIGDVALEVTKHSGEEVTGYRVEGYRVQGFSW